MGLEYLQIVHAMVEELKKRREEKRTRMVQRYWPEFLEAKKKEMEQDSDQS
jgi:hypothetical protein